MSNLISRQDAIDALGEKPLAWTEGEYELGLQNQWQSDVDALKDLPSAEPTERTAKVISDDVIITVNGYRYHYEEYLCNACKKKVFSCDSYCSHCGAKLDWSWNE